MPYNSTIAIQDAIKRALKVQRISYQDLAKRLKMTESGVKKLLNRPDLSIARASAIGAVLGLSFSELAAEASTSQASTQVEISVAVQEFFASDIDAFHVYWLVAAEHRELDEVQNVLKLSRQALFRYLRKLDSLKLIELLSGDKIRVPSTGPVIWPRKGPFMPTLMRRWSKAIVEYVIDNANKEQHFALRHCRLTNASLRELTRAFEDLNSEFTARSMRESKAYANEELIEVATLSAVAAESLVALDRMQKI